MFEIKQPIAAAVSRENLALRNPNRAVPAYMRETVSRINLGKQFDTRPARTPASPARSTAAQPARPCAAAAPQAQPPVQAPRKQKLPDMYKLAGRGQKLPLGLNQGCRDRLSVCFGWNVTNPACDIDASAFLLNSGGRVPGDDWFVFYGHDMSPDKSTAFISQCREDREIISVDFARLSPSITKLVFVLTINEALEKHLNFGMIQDAYVRVLNGSNQELVSFKVSEYFSTVTSMTLCEIYLHNGQWKFNPVGNGVSQDLAGQCHIYGVNIV